MGLKCVSGRIVVKVDVNQKNGYTFSDGTEIVLERDVENLDRKYTQQVLGIVIDAENIPEGALILFHHNSLHETYHIHNHNKLSGKEIASGINIFSIMERDCFLWKNKDEKKWHPTENYATALRVFKPYDGPLFGIEPTLIKNALYVTSGEYRGLVVMTVKAADYEITFRDHTTGRDEKIIRFRPNGDEKENREPEAICILNNLCEKVNNGELLLGLYASDCKPLKEPKCQPNLN